MKIMKVITFFCIILLLTGCSEKFSTQQMIASSEIKQDPEVDLFLIDRSVYKKVNNLNEDDVELKKFTKIGEIKSIYKGKGDMVENMSTKLPIKTEIYRSNDKNRMVIAKTDTEVIEYESIPEG